MQNCQSSLLNRRDFYSETLVKSTADNLVKRGYLSVGYKYVAIDDCWLAMTRDKSGNIQPDPQRFPSGIKALADYVRGQFLYMVLFDIDYYYYYYY